MPALQPVTDRMLVDDSGYLWIKLNEEREESGHTLTAFDVFDEKGFYVYQVWSAVAPALFRNGKMYSVEVDGETGERLLKRYRIL